MTLSIRRALRSQAKPLIGFYSESGGGKTRAALMLARGFVGPEGKIVMAETESGRGESYADQIPGGFDVIPIRPEDGFSPRTYGEAIALAEKSQADALIVDSCSHEWEGIGGVLHMAALNQEAGKKGKQVWLTPKIEHQRFFLGKLLQTPIKLVILCMRAKYPIEEKIVDGKKEMVRSTNLEPKQSEDILYDLFVHGWFDRETHAFHGTNYLHPELRQIIRDGKPIDISTGEALARWSSGNGKPSPELGVVLALVERATTIDELTAASAGAAALVEHEKKIVREAYKGRHAALSKPV